MRMLLFEMVPATFVQTFAVAYSWLNENLISPFITFTRVFEFALIFSAAVLFFLISVFLLLKQARMLPKTYAIEIVDLYGNKTSIDGVRQVFSTHEAAESYARMYSDAFGQQYKFRVVGVSKAMDTASLL